MTLAEFILSLIRNHKGDIKSFGKVLSDYGTIFDENTISAMFAVVINHSVNN